MADFPKQEVTTPGSTVPSDSDVFATLHHLVSRIDAEDRVDEVIEKAQDLDVEETQLLVDCLIMSLDKDAAPLKTRLHVWRSLIKVASSAKVFAQNRILNSEYISPEDSSASPSLYKISGDIPTRVKVRKSTRNDGDLYTEALISWVHLSHPNILPLYAVFLKDNDHPCLVSPSTVDQNMGDYLRDNPDVSRILLVSDVINGLSCMHQLDIVHGELNPESVLISSNGRAVIADPNPSEPNLVRYSALELLADEGIKPTKASDMWAFACLFYEVLTGNIPFCHITKEFRVALAIAGGTKPSRPGRGVGGNEIDDAIWQIMLMCWEFEPEGRPACLTIQQMLMGMVIQDDRIAAKPMVRPEAMKRSSIDIEQAKGRLIGVLGSDQSPSLRVPEHLRKSLATFVSDTTKLNATAVAAKKLSPSDTQMLVDFLDLVLEDLPQPDERRPTRTLLSSIMSSTHVIPLRYKFNGLQYDPTPMFEGIYAKGYKGHGLDVRVNAVTASWLVKSTFALLPDWCHTSHPNLVPFYGVIQEGAIESPRLYVVTSFWPNGFLEDYAFALPQKSRLPLISDIADGMVFLLSRGVGFTYSKKEHVLISDEGRAVLAMFGSSELFSTKATSATRILRFRAPSHGYYHEDNVWSFGCLCYTVLTRKEPYYQYAKDDQIRSAVSQSELPKRPDGTDDDMDELDDQAWDLITKCCKPERRDRLTSTALKEVIASWKIEDNRPPAKHLPESHLLALRSRPNMDFGLVEVLLGKIQVELLRSPLSKLLQNHIKDIAKAAVELESDDTRALVDFLDLALKDHLSISEEQNRVLALLSRITSSTHVFPRRYVIQGIKYDPRPMAAGGFGTVHRGTDINVCVKVMTQVDPKALTPWIRELILWAHASHTNILPFCGVLLENVGGTQRICLVSPFMKNGNLREYAPSLAQKSRLPLMLDVANGLGYLHVLGIVHSDLKGENVLISNEGRCLITDFGSTQITTATLTVTASVVPTTLRFAAPEAVLNSGPPTKESDIWSFGCLCYEVLSRQVPYHQYSRDIQISAALARKELPKRPGTAGQGTTNETDNEWDDEDDEDWDEIDDQAWGLITKCCAPEPEDRLEASAIQELIVDMKVWDDRSAAKGVLGTEISKLRANPEIDLSLVGEVLDKLQKAVVPTEEKESFDFSDLFNSLVNPN
ncbi:hypothetical protein D9756_002598 [Leucocoprinus leucothites]|uniref:Protein kinase domain-containing protein n=1 Tax=Leucocoprinus leucothites TaxID=201217 RepID=A0A8H5GBH0_9AGAR|nr:hypothetical protein D9756_002598 [Leucoagaricus leucothites]